MSATSANIWVPTRARALVPVVILLAALNPSRGQSQTTLADPARAQQSAGSAADAAIKAYAVPESPAFTFLGVSPAKISRPTTPRDLITALTNTIDERGHVVQGTALEFQPTALVRSHVGLATYQKRGLGYILNNAQLSLATTRTSGDTTSADLAYGVRFTLLDRADPMADKAGFTDSLSEVLGKCSPNLPPLVPNAPARDSVVQRLALSQQQQCNRDSISALSSRYAKRSWNATHVAIAYAGGNRLLSSALSSTKYIGQRGWLVAGVPATQFGELIGYLEWANVVLNGATQRSNALSYGGRAVVGKPTFNGFLELVGQHRQNPAPGTKSNADSWSGGLEFRVADQLWLATGLGKGADAIKSGPSALIASLRWGFSDKARFTPQ